MKTRRPSSIALGGSLVFGAACDFADDNALFEHFWAQLATLDPPLGEAWWARSYQDAVFLEDARGDAIAYAFAYAIGDEGHVAHLVVDEALRGRGAGRSVMESLGARLHQRGCTRWSLNVRRDNEPALALYRRCGMIPRYSTEVVVMHWEATEALPHDDALTVRALGACARCGRRPRGRARRRDHGRIAKAHPALAWSRVRGGARR